MYFILAIGALVISSIALILSIVAVVKNNNPDMDENSTSYITRDNKISLRSNGSGC